MSDNYVEVFAKLKEKWELTGNAIENLLRSYASNIVSCELDELKVKQADEDEGCDDYNEYYEKNPTYNQGWITGYKVGVERWMQELGISEMSPYVKLLINREKWKRREEYAEYGIVIKNPDEKKED